MLDQSLQRRIFEELEVLGASEAVVEPPGLLGCDSLGHVWATV